MAIDKRQEIIEEFLALFGMGSFGDPNDPVDMEGILSRLTDDVEWWISGTPPILLTKDAFRNGGNIFANIANSELRITPTAWTFDGNRVAVEAYSNMKLKSGGAYNNHYHFTFELRGDKISLFHEHFDTAHLQECIRTGEAVTV
jgi:ketosteroid isomerase-like protein